VKFVFNLAYREMRASWRRLLFFFLCIAIGVGSIVALRSLVQNVNASIVRESRSLLTADVQVSASAPLNDQTKAVLDRYANSPMVAAQTQVIESSTMLRSLKSTGSMPKMVDVKAVEAGFPFYGEMLLGDGAVYSHELLRNHGVLVKQGMLISMGLQIGDKVRIGEANFTIRGVIEREPGGTMNGFSFAPRVLIDFADAASAGLIGRVSRTRLRMLYRSRPDVDSVLADSLRRDLRSQAGVNVRSFRSSQDQMSRTLGQVEDYLSLIGLIILVLGGIGVSSVTRVFVDQKIKTIAILKCLGGRNARVLGAYLLQVLGLGLLGSLMGLGIARVATGTLPKFFADKLPLNVEFGMTWQASLQGVTVGLLISLLFSLTPLLKIRRIKPNLVLRSLSGGEKQSFDWLRLVTSVVVALGLVGVASWQAGSLKIGGIFLIGLTLMAGVLALAATGLMKFLRGLRRLPYFPLRQGINSLYRPGNQTRIILMAVGLGVFFVVSVRSLQLNLRAEFSPDLDNLRADLYLIDIQKDQREGVEEIIRKHTGDSPVIVPTVRARISRINDGEVASDREAANRNRDRKSNRGGNQNMGLLGREYILTYRDYVEDFEQITAGTFWDRTPNPEGEISIEELLHDELGLNVGDRVMFDVMGRSVSARVSNIRRVDWRNARTGFLIVFRPGALDDAPAMYISAIKGPVDNAVRAQMQRELVDRFSNISVVDVRDLIELARGIIQNISLAISFVGGFVFLSGLLILIGSIAMTKFHRLYESAILKTLGAKRKLIVGTLLVEYGALGLIAGLLGSVSAIALTWAISEYGLKIPWRFIPSVNFLGVAVTTILVMLVGVASSWDVMIKKPLGILRSE
jgi:putative ABC transport system permease protein